MSTITVPGHRPQDALRNVTKNVFTLSVITDYIIMFFVPPLRKRWIMEPPFIFGKIATEKNFTLINTIIISPRCWGKSSLANKAAKLATEPDNKLKICHIDLFNARNEEHFYSLLVQTILQVRRPDVP